jgi:methylated-DNA-protein-cysteine methyltransferase related protein
MSARFTSSPDVHEFNRKVWAIVRQIPAGRVMTYGQIGSLISPPAGVTAISYRSFAPRWVGGAMANCPSDVPWQRVINSQGKISERRGGGVTHQRDLLEAEGVLFDERGRVDLRRYAWEGPTEEWLETQGITVRTEGD